VLRAAADGAIKLGAMRCDSFFFFFFSSSVCFCLLPFYLYLFFFPKVGFFSSFDGRNTKKNKKKTDVGCVVSPFAMIMR
jgi:hypothetical protein